jgi:acyl carrier protein
MDNLDQVQEKVRQFIVKTSYIQEDQISNDTLIFAQGIMDSMGFISIIDFLEDSFSISASDNELLEANFESVNAIANFVLRKKQYAADQLV